VLIDWRRPRGGGRHRCPGRGLHGRPNALTYPGP
jgi:hypothetical protein